jgi:hypothetical protein
MFKNLDKFQLKKLIIKSFLAARIEFKNVFGILSSTKDWNLVKISAP